MAKTGTVTIDLQPMTEFREAISKKSAPIRSAIKQWAFRVRAFWQERFDKYSKGGGNWPDLADSTKRARRGTGVFTILRDTGLMFAAIGPAFKNAPGQLEKELKFGVRVGFGGPGKYPSGASLFDIASFHQEGKGFLPKREIIVDPSSIVIKGMRDDMERAIKKLSHG